MTIKKCKLFRLTNSEWLLLQKYKSNSGMTYSSIAEKAISSFIKNGFLVNINKLNARHKNYNGEAKTKILNVHLSENVLLTANKYCEINKCHFIDLFNDAVEKFYNNNG